MQRTRGQYGRAGIVASLVAVPLVLTACGGEESTGSADSITVAISSSPSADALQAIAADFEAETGVTVEFVDIPYDQLTSQILLGARQPDQGFDVIQFDSPMLAALVEAGALADLTDRVESSEAYNAGDFSEQVDEYARYDDTAYGIPLSTEPYVLWYRTDLFADLGLSLEPTWDTYVANARALEASGVAGNGSGFGAQIGGYYWLEAIYLHGGTLLEPGTCTPALDTPQALAATETYLDLRDTTPATVVNGGGNEMTTAFAQGQVGQQINATGYWSTISDPDQSQVLDAFDMTLPPMTDDGSTLLFGWLIGVGEQSAAKDTAWEFLEFALGQDAMDRLIEEGAPPPARQSLLENEAALESIPYLPTLVEAAARGDHLPYITQMPEIITALSVQLNAAASDGTDAEALLAAAQSEVESIMSGAETCG
ncbi:ABC transporter substrate-binding protein [Jiangella asiatica]|uniref:Sugar ABC transporter substrate-binding protein n=1 Tax=Jiangella asiatica TaxID=2530372 RepID=A0A4R5DCZ0_9ACTN|nr:sugar ABC transporter substrate-binding protein [Jiangella asiatica]TDE08133.1 sugar ABC transporter substrate-binding protein [Jiangella asiatica]